MVSLDVVVKRRYHRPRFLVAASTLKERFEGQCVSAFMMKRSRFLQTCYWYWSCDGSFGYASRSIEFTLIETPIAVPRLCR